MARKKTVAEQLAEADAYILEHDIDITNAREAYKSMHPNVDDSRIDLALRAEVGILMNLEPAFNVESIARKLADEHGAFPFDGPVGNGLMLEYYQGRFREMAEEHVLLAQLLGIF